MDDQIAFNVEQFVRRRACFDPDVPAMPETDRRVWWVFYSDMAELLRNLLLHGLVSGEQEERVTDLLFLCICGNWALATPAPMLRAEQWRYVDALRWIDGAFAAAVGDLPGVRDMSDRMPGHPHPVAVSEALRSPWMESAYPTKALCERAGDQSADLRGLMLSKCGVGTTVRWPTRDDIQRMCDEALASGRRYLLDTTFPAWFAPQYDPIAGVEACCDLETAFDQADLSLNARRIAYARLQGITREESPGELRMSKREAQTAWKELNRKEKSIRRALRKKI